LNRYDDPRGLLSRFGRKSGCNHPRKTSFVYVYIPGFVEQGEGNWP
jgi:hypothetical protein